LLFEKRVKFTQIKRRVGVEECGPVGGRFSCMDSISLCRQQYLMIIMLML